MDDIDLSAIPPCWAEAFFAKLSDENQDDDIDVLTQSPDDIDFDAILTSHDDWDEE